MKLADYAGEPRADDLVELPSGIVKRFGDWTADELRAAIDELCAGGFASVWTEPDTEPFEDGPS